MNRKNLKRRNRELRAEIESLKTDHGNVAQVLHRYMEEGVFRVDGTWQPKPEVENMLCDLYDEYTGELESKNRGW